MSVGHLTFWHSIKWRQTDGQTCKTTWTTRECCRCYLTGTTAWETLVLMFDRKGKYIKSNCRQIGVNVHCVSVCSSARCIAVCWTNETLTLYWSEPLFLVEIEATNVSGYVCVKGHWEHSDPKYVGQNVSLVSVGLCVCVCVCAVDVSHSAHS